MSKDYVHAKNIALGKVMPASDHESDAIWDVNPQPDPPSRAVRSVVQTRFAPPDESWHTKWPCPYTMPNTMGTKGRN